MKYIALGLSLSLTNICNPFYCLFQIFSWPKANEVIVKQNCEGEEGDEKKQCENKVPETVAEMKELIRVAYLKKISKSRQIQSAKSYLKRLVK